jgi:hypothetical protein
MGYRIDSVEVRNADGFGVFPVELPKLEGMLLPGWVEPPTEPDTTRHPWCTDEAGFARLVGNGLAISFPCHGGDHGDYEDLRDKLLPHFRGYAELIFTWAEGDSFSALRCDNGKVTDHEVVLTLGPERKR